MADSMARPNAHYDGPVVTVTQGDDPYVLTGARLVADFKYSDRVATAIARVNTDDSSILIVDGALGKWRFSIPRSTMEVLGVGTFVWDLLRVDLDPDDPKLIAAGTLVVSPGITEYIT